MTPERVGRGWDPIATALIQRAIEAHGGAARWRKPHRISLPFEHVSGALIALKGHRRTFTMPRQCDVTPHDRVAIFHGFPDKHHRGRFDNGHVRIERVETQQIVAESAHHRASFSPVRKYRRWSPLDALYFFGYAICHYHALPFTLPDADLVRTISRHGRAVGVDVAFADDVPTHNRQQRFYFDDEGRIVRHDYVADVISALARGAHYWEHYERCDGLLIARRRRVVARLGHWALPAQVLFVDFGPPAIAWL